MIVPINCIRSQTNGIRRRNSKNFASFSSNYVNLKLEVWKETAGGGGGGDWSSFLAGSLGTATTALHSIMMLFSYSTTHNGTDAKHDRC
jgi:hypothetical protein